MDLDLTKLAELVPSARGRPAAPVVLEYVRDLGPGDIDTILNPPKLPAVESGGIVKELAYRHHMLARLVAEGVKGVDIHAITGYSQSRISIFSADPAFQELVAHYRGQIEAKYFDIHERLAQLGITCIEELQKRFEDEPESFSNKEIRELMAEALERSGRAVVNKAPQGGGTQAPVNVQINFVKSPNAAPEALENVTTLEIDPE